MGVLLRAIWVTVLLLLAVTPAASGGIVIGPFCIDDADAQSDYRKTTFAADGKWTKVRFARDWLGREQGMLAVFKQNPGPANGRESCQAIIERESELGHTPLLAGRVERLNIEGFIFESNSGTNRFQIDPSGFQARVGRVLVGDLSVLGGTTQLAGSKLWITNTETILIEADKISGGFEIEAWNRIIRNANVDFNGLKISGLTFAPKGPLHENVTFRINLATGETRLWNGHLVAPHSGPVSSLVFEVAGVRLTDININYSRVEIVARQGVVRVSLLGLDGNAVGAEQVSGYGRFDIQNPKFKLERLAAVGEQTSAGLVTHDAELAGLEFEALHGAILGRNGSVVIEGVLSGQVGELTAEKFNAALGFANPKSAVISLLSGSKPSDAVTLRLRRDKNDLRVGGSIDASALVLGKLSVEQPLRLALRDARANLSNPSVTLEFPVNINIPPAQGTVNFYTEDYKVGLTGKLAGLRLKGLLKVPLDDVEASHLFVAANDFFLGIGLAAFLEPLIAGVVPTLTTTDLTFGNPTDLKVGLNSEGRILTSVSELIIGEPVFNIGEGGKKAKASLALHTQAGADLLYDLAKGRVLIARGTLVADDVRFHFLEPGGEIDLNGTMLSNPEITLEHLEINFTGTDDYEFGTAYLKQFVAAGDRLYKSRDPAKVHEVTFDSRIRTPLSLGEGRALKVRYRTELSLEILQLKSLAFAITNAEADFGDDIGVSDATFSLSATEINRGQVNDDSYVWVSNARIDVSGRLRAGLNNRPSFRISVAVSGPAHALDGTGSAVLSPFSGGRVFDAEINFKCANGDKLKVPSEINIAVAGLSLDVTVTDGEFSASGQAAPFAALFHTIASRDCDSKVEKWVIVPEKSGWTWGFCDFPPRKCKWKWTTPEINFQYKIKLAIRFASLSLFMTNPIINLNNDKVRFCNRGYATVGTAVVAGGYSPQIVTNYPGADEIVNAIISAHFEAPQTMIATSFLTALLPVISDIINVGQVVCYG